MGLQALLGVACDAGEPDPEPKGPALNLVEVLGTNGVDRKPFALADAVGVTTSTAVRLRFDRYLDPAAASRQAVCLRSDLASVERLEECTENLFLRPTYDPATRTVTYYQQDDDARLAPDTLYKLTVFPAAADAAGYAAFDGAPLAARFELTFQTSATESKTSELPKEDDVLAQNARFCGSVLSVFKRSCAPCHAAAGAPMGLSLVSGGAVLATAVGKVAHQSQVGGDAATPLVRPSRFGVAMPLVAPGNPGESYLLYKLLVGDVGDDEMRAVGEAGRLKRSAVVGLAMPPAPYAVTHDEVVAISEWIARGATTFDCDAPIDPGM